MNKPTKKNLETFATLLKLAAEREEKAKAAGYDHNELVTYEAWELGTTAQSFKVMCERMQEEAKAAGYEMIYCEGYYTSKYANPDNYGYTPCKVIFRKIEAIEEKQTEKEDTMTSRPTFKQINKMSDEDLAALAQNAKEDGETAKTFAGRFLKTIIVPEGVGRSEMGALRKRIITMCGETVPAPQRSTKISEEIIKAVQECSELIKSPVGAIDIRIQRAALAILSRLQRGGSFQMVPAIAFGQDLQVIKKAVTTISPILAKDNIRVVIDDNYVSASVVIDEPTDRPTIEERIQEAQEDVEKLSESGTNYERTGAEEALKALQKIEDMTTAQRAEHLWEYASAGGGNDYHWTKASLTDDIDDTISEMMNDWYAQDFLEDEDRDAIAAVFRDQRVVDAAIALNEE